MNPQFDDRDAELLAERQAAFDGRQGPRVGDYIHMLDGTLRRFTYNWEDGLQTTYLWKSPANRTLYGSHACGGSFYFGRGGYMSFSGSLDSSIPLRSIEDTGETRKGPCWFFHHDWSAAHNGVDAQVVCRVYRQREAV